MGLYLVVKKYSKEEVDDNDKDIHKEQVHEDKHVEQLDSLHDGFEDGLSLEESISYLEESSAEPSSHNSSIRSLKFF